MLNVTQWSEASREMFRFAQHDNQSFLQEVYYPCYNYSIFFSPTPYSLFPAPLPFSDIQLLFKA